MKKAISIMIVLAIILLAMLLFFIVRELKELKIDHECYMMNNEEFFNTKMCEPYWSYRYGK